MLFVDASRINVRELRADAGLPVRLLGIGLPLTIALGFIVAAALYRDTGLWVAAADRRRGGADRCRARCRRSCRTRGCRAGSDEC